MKSIFIIVEEKTETRGIKLGVKKMEQQKQFDLKRCLEKDNGKCLYNWEDGYTAKAKVTAIAMDDMVLGYIKDSTIVEGHLFQSVPYARWLSLDKLENLDRS